MVHQINIKGISTFENSLICGQKPGDSKLILLINGKSVCHFSLSHFTEKYILTQTSKLAIAVLSSPLFLDVRKSNGPITEDGVEHMSVNFDVLFATCLRSNTAS